MSVIGIKKEYRKPEFIKQIFSDFIADFLSSNNEECNKWKDNITQTSFESVLKSKKMKMQNPNKVIEDKQKKLDKKLKREARDRDLQENKVKKAIERPKLAYYYFMQDEKEKVKQKLIDNGYVGNSKTLKKNVHVELQNIWKEVKNNNIEMYTQYKLMEETGKLSEV